MSDRTTYVRTLDGAVMVEIAPGIYVEQGYALRFGLIR